jgi:hypothetical protein
MAKTVKTGSGCLVLFSLPFAAVGVGMGAWLMSGVATYWKMQGWEETPARIVRAELESHPGSKGGTTYEATAEYTYQFGGRWYTGKRIGIGGGSDNVGSYQQDVHRQLSEHRRSRRPFPCYVNPENPAEAVLFRDLRWEMVGFQTIFAAVFGTVGFALFTFAVLSVFKERGNRALAADHPDEPWLWKKDWAEGTISSSGSTSTIVLLVCALAWNLASTPVWFVFPHDAFDKGHRLALLLLAFPAIGAILVLSAVVSVLRWRKYGQSVLEMASVPGVIGGQLAGVIRVPAKVRPEEGFRLSLDCVCISTAGKSRTETSVWQDEQVIARDLSQGNPEQSAIPVLFQIPYECRPTDETEANSQTVWRLAVSAKTPGLDYSTRFEVPVFKTPESDPNFVVDRSLIAEYAAPENPDRDLHDAGVIKTESPTGEGFRLVFPMARAPGMGVAMMVVGAVFGGVPIAMFHFDAPWLINAIFGLVFGAIGLLLLACAVDVWLYRSVVDVSAAGLTVVGGLFGLGRENRINAANIEMIEPVSRMSSGEGQSAKKWYDIQVVYRPTSKLTIGKRILGKRLAESVIRQIEQAIGKHQSES